MNPAERLQRLHEIRRRLGPLRQSNGREWTSNHAELANLVAQLVELELPSPAAAKGPCRECAGMGVVDRLISAAAGKVPLQCTACHGTGQAR